MNVRPSPDVKQLLGQSVTIIIDHPFGSRHPEHNFIYPLNYGYLPSHIAADGEALDAYVLGVFEPVETFSGTCIAIVHRKNDVEDKLVLAPAGKRYSAEQISALVEFQERFWDTEILTNNH